MKIADKYVPIPPLPETELMQNMPNQERNEAIAASENVVDLRPKLSEKMKQRQLAAKYRKPQKPNGDGPSHA